MPDIALLGEPFKNITFFDRALEVRGEKEIGEFLDDPKGFLQRCGYLDGLPEFNGLVDADGRELDLNDLRRQWERRGKGAILRCGHLGIPYSLDYYCINTCHLV